MLDYKKINMITMLILKIHRKKR